MSPIPGEDKDVIKGTRQKINKSVWGIISRRQAYSPREAGDKIEGVGWAQTEQKRCWYSGKGAWESQTAHTSNW